MSCASRHFRIPKAQRIVPILHEKCRGSGSFRKQVNPLGPDPLPGNFPPFRTANFYSPDAHSPFAVGSSENKEFQKCLCRGYGRASVTLVESSEEMQRLFYARGTSVFVGKKKNFTSQVHTKIAGLQLDLVRVPKFDY